MKIECSNFEYETGSIEAELAWDLGGDICFFRNDGKSIFVESVFLLLFFDQAFEWFNNRRQRDFAHLLDYNEYTEAIKWTLSENSMICLTVSQYSGAIVRLEFTEKEFNGGLQKSFLDLSEKLKSLDLRYKAGWHTD